MRISAVQLAESVDRISRLGNATPAAAASAVARLLNLDRRPDIVVTLDAATGIRAGVLRAANYHRERCPISLTDAIAAATALLLGAPLATSDGPLARVVRREGGFVTPLPDSRGRRP